MIRPSLIVLTLTAALLAGCGDDNDGSPSSAATTTDAAMEQDAAKPKGGATTEAAMRPKGKIVKVVDSQFGRVIADGKGEAFYPFDKERTTKSQCYGECAAAWPPVLTKGQPRAGRGPRQKLLGTTKRRDGKLQVTYAGHPLYYYVDDSPGNILCQNVDEFGGLWLVVMPNGKPVI